MGILPELVHVKSDVIQTYEDDLIGKKTFQFDFQKNEFVTDIMGGTVMTSTPNEMLEQVVNKILHDSRYKNLIYPDSYGNEVKVILEQDDPFEVVKCELKRVYEEALIYHPLIESVNDFSVENEGDKIICSFTVEGVNGTLVDRVEEINYGITKL